MPRIPLIARADEVPVAHRDVWTRIAKSRGSVVGPFAALLHSPVLADRTAELGAYIRFDSTLSAIDRELVILSVARVFDCRFEWAYHVREARKAGVRTEAITAAIADAALIVACVGCCCGHAERGGPTFVKRMNEVERDLTAPYVRPKDAATLILVDRSGPLPKVLLGKRHERGRTLRSVHGRLGSAARVERPRRGVDRPLRAGLLERVEPRRGHHDRADSSSGASAIISISTSAPLGRALTAIVERAGSDFLVANGAHDLAEEENPGGQSTSSIF